MKNILIVLSIFLIVSTYQAQEETEETVQETEQKEFKNQLKMNLMGLVMRNYSFQYERVIGRKFSVALGYSFIPNGGIPLKSSIESQITDDEETKKTLNSLELSASTITPEFRFYLSKKAGKGFYFAPFYRHSKYKVSNYKWTYTDSETQKEEEINASGEVSANTFGLMMGTQFKLSKRMSLDWWILGPNFGSATGSILGTTTQTLSAENQQEIRDELNDIDISFIDTKVEVNEHGGKLLFDGGWGGIRTGLTLGFWF